MQLAKSQIGSLANMPFLLAVYRKYFHLGLLTKIAVYIDSLAFSSHFSVYIHVDLISLGNVVSFVG